MKAVNCLGCGDILYNLVPLDEKGHSAMDANTRLDLESDGEDQYLLCPHCKVKNVVISTTSISGLLEIRPSHIK